MPSIRQPLTMLLLLALTPGAHAQLYKWVDANGDTHYSDHKPTGISTDTVPQKSVSVKTAPAPEPANLDKLRQKADKAALDNAKRQEAEQSQLEKQRECRNATEYYNYLQDRRPTTDNQNTGERMDIPDAPFERRLHNAENNMREKCR